MTEMMNISTKICDFYKNTKTKIKYICIIDNPMIVQELKKIVSPNVLIFDKIPRNTFSFQIDLFFISNNQNVNMDYLYNDIISMYVSKYGTLFIADSNRPNLSIDKYNIERMYDVVERSFMITKTNKFDGMHIQSNGVQSGSHIQSNNESKQYRVAILLTGLTRRYKDTYKSWFDNLINVYPNVQFDFYLALWNVQGDYDYSNKFHDRDISKNWVNTKNHLGKADYDEIRELYKPRELKVFDYNKWEELIKEDFDNFVERHTINTDRLRVYNGVYSQYYLIMEGFKLIAKQEDIKYDIILKSRFDLFLKPEQKPINWDVFTLICKENIVSLSLWDRMGIKGSLIAGGFDLMQKYSMLFAHINKMTVDDMKHIKLPSIVIPEYSYNYLLADRDAELMTDKEIHECCYPEMCKMIVEFLGTQRFLKFKFNVIPEIFLSYYLRYICKIDIFIEPYLDVEIVSSIK